MSYSFDSRFGRQLYDMLPEVYRTRDRYDPHGDAGSEDLARYLDAHGHLLDLIQATLRRQLDDTLPATSQAWLLPYFAQLLAVNIVSPDPQGKHDEVAHAVSWRQRKGTLKVAEEIVEAVGNMEAEIQEGWQRVAVTPRIGMPLTPVAVVDDALDIDERFASRMARHPSLPAATVDLRRPSRAVEALPTNPAAKVSRFGGLSLAWRQLNRHGAPCFPGSFDDVSRRSVDLRDVDSGHGRYHHKRVLVYVAPPDGLIPFDAIELVWEERLDSLYQHLISHSVENGVQVIRNNSARVVTISNNVELAAGLYRIEGLNFAGELKVASGGRLTLGAVEAVRVDVATAALDEPVISASDCLFGELSCGGLVQLERCTVRDDAFLTALDARDCLFTAIVGSDIRGVIEFSRYPADAPFSADGMTIEDCVTDAPLFFDHQSGLAARSVLAPDCPPGIWQGAANGGEMGGFNRGREGRPVRLAGDFTGPDALHLADAGGLVLCDVIFEGNVAVAGGRLALRRCVLPNLAMETGLAFAADDAALPALDAQDCLFTRIALPSGLARLEYCTVMQQAHCLQLQASDCIFAGDIGDGAGGEPESGCLRYSRIPATLDGTSLNAGAGRNSTNTRQGPVFARFDYCSGGAHQQRVAAYGEAGYGVLDRHSPPAIRFGAEDGGEMGAHHHRYYSLKFEAMQDKLIEFLPVGMEPVLIVDRRLLSLPPEIKNSSNGGST
ncbi:MAG: Phage tail protein (Tail_P2_I) [Candidatus Accumulibacter phosphatis]|uniref:Phage tail protein (Tail_P2_I) n=1 Tax=Candidatus Accumulibacter phosphatis TaxID=327160 RepID=A0A080M179_9PROT|nr:phage tail protein [Accumulibacter sp.]KFB74040.1 MAG: Phage tail protein (Tail_P2_I) [Candidatus Accumulibacter phosphatis]HRF06664.1 phage tail protein [Accumulibacter sp.]